jgi:NAD(P) transhydrogenase subunit beta
MSLILIAAARRWAISSPRKVQMTQMPELVAIMHSSWVWPPSSSASTPISRSARVAADFMPAGPAVPAARRSAVDLPTGFWDAVEFRELIGKKTGVEIGILRVELVLGIWIGAVTFTGSVVAYGKLAGNSSLLPFKIDTRPSSLPGGHMLNAAAAAASVLLLILYMSGAGTWALVLLALLGFFIGYHLIMGIGGADMPVVVSMLNSYSGWAAAAIGFSLGNDLLIVVARWWAPRVRS